MTKEKRELMVFFQLKLKGITNKKILDIFLEIPRENFIPANIKNLAYEDSPLPIGYNQTISQPYVVALMTKLLNPKSNDIILEIGTGSGYQAAILSKLCKKIISLEIIKELAESAKNNLKEYKNVIVKNSDGTDLKEKIKFDKIIVTAATPKIPEIWVKKLKENGILVLPQGDLYSQTLLKYKKINNKLKLIKKSIPVRFVPLKGKIGF